MTDQNQNVLRLTPGEVVQLEALMDSEDGARTEARP